MTPRRCLALLLCLFPFAAACSDGGPVGTGISRSQLSGTVIAVDESGGGAAALDTPVQVSIDEAPGVETTTDAAGYFELSGEFSGALTLRFAATAVAAATTVDVPLGASLELDDIRLRRGVVEFSRPRLRRFTGRVALVDCSLDTPGAAEVLVDDRTGLANQFLVRISADTALLSGNGDDLPCGQIKLRDRIAVEGVILPDRTVAAIAIIVAPPAAAQTQPLVEVRFRGTVAVVNCDSGLVEFIDDVTGRTRLRIEPTSVLVERGPPPGPLRRRRSGGSARGEGPREGPASGRHSGRPGHRARTVVSREPPRARAGDPRAGRGRPRLGRCRQRAGVCVAHRTQRPAPHHPPGRTATCGTREGNDKKIGRITPAGVITEFTAGITPGERLRRITSPPAPTAICGSPSRGNRIGRITPAGVIPSSAPGDAGGVLRHRRTRRQPVVFRVRISRTDHTDGVITEFRGRFRRRTAGISPGPDGNLWFTEVNGYRIGRITIRAAWGHRYSETGFFQRQSPLRHHRLARTAICGSPKQGTDRIGRITPAGT